MLLQRLNKNDLPEIIAFNRRCFSPGDRWSEEDWTELLEDERAPLLRAAGEWADRGEYVSLRLAGGKGFPENYEPWCCP